MKIYVAARFHEKEHVKQVYKKLQQHGHTITQDWTNCTTRKPFSVYTQDAQKCALHAVSGVQEADVFILLTNPEIGGGSSVEFGAALMRNTLSNKPHIYIVGPHIENNICYYHPKAHIKKSVDEVIQELARSEACCNSKSAESEPHI